MTAWIIPLQINLVDHLLIYLTLTFMIDPAHKRSRYTLDLLSDAISVVSGENSTLTSPYDSLDLLPTDDPNILHVVKKSVPLLGRVKIVYWCRKHDQKRCYKNTNFSCSTYSNKSNKFCYCHRFSSINSETRTCFLGHSYVMSQFFS